MKNLQRLDYPLKHHLSSTPINITNEEMINWKSCKKQDSRKNLHERYFILFFQFFVEFMCKNLVCLSNYIDGSISLKIKKNASN
jgi:hypothetical protein